MPTDHDFLTLMAYADFLEENGHDIEANWIRDDLKNPEPPWELELSVGITVGGGCGGRGGRIAVGGITVGGGRIAVGGGIHGTGLVVGPIRVGLGVEGVGGIGQHPGVAGSDRAGPFDPFWDD